MGTKSLLMAMAALTIAGCSQNEVTEINPDADRTIGSVSYTHLAKSTNIIGLVLLAK